ncbi:MAG: hypothetical protein WBA51_11380 [Erythrobacter sp.]
MAEDAGGYGIMVNKALGTQIFALYSITAAIVIGKIPITIDAVHSKHRPINRGKSVNHRKTLAVAHNAADREKRRL